MTQPCGEVGGCSGQQKFTGDQYRLPVSGRHLWDVSPGQRQLFWPLLREIREQRYEGNYTILKDYVHPRRQPRQPKATMRFETGPGEQAQVDSGVVSYKGEDGRKHRMWAFVMVLNLKTVA